MREGSEEGEEVSTPVKKQRMGELLESPDSSHSRDSETQRGDGSTGRPTSAERSDDGRGARETNGKIHGNGNGELRRDTERTTTSSPLRTEPQPLEPADEDLSEEGEVA